MGPKGVAALWNTLIKIASEDIGIANQIAPVVISTLKLQYSDLRKTNNKKKPERLPLVNAVLFLANSLKSRLVDNLLTVVYGKKDLENNNPVIPEYAIDKHTRNGIKGEAGIEKFYNDGDKLDREAIVDPYKYKAREILLMKEKLKKESLAEE
jgi:replication-associated recombination protein RarA